MEHYACSVLSHILLAMTFLYSSLRFGTRWGVNWNPVGVTSRCLIAYRFRCGSLTENGVPGQCRDAWNECNHISRICVLICVCLCCVSLCACEYVACWCVVCRVLCVVVSCAVCCVCCVWRVLTSDRCSKHEICVLCSVFCVSWWFLFYRLVFERRWGPGAAP